MFRSLICETELQHKRTIRHQFRAGIFTHWDHQCADPADTLDHVVPRSAGGLTVAGCGFTGSCCSNPLLSQAAHLHQLERSVGPDISRPHAATGHEAATASASQVDEAPVAAVAKATGPPADQEAVEGLQGQADRVDVNGQA